MKKKQKTKTFKTSTFLEGEIIMARFQVTVYKTGTEVWVVNAKDEEEAQLKFEDGKRIDDSCEVEILEVIKLKGKIKEE